jgi:tetraacyldisaccharide 4'-kinase
MRMYFYNIITGEKPVPLKAVLRPVLVLLSVLFLVIIELRTFMYKIGLFESMQLPRPVISIGNITWGGTGKTPLVEAILIYLQSRDLRPALLTRGYGEDENRVIASAFLNVSVISGKHRALNAINFLKKDKADIFVIDDGFQHLRLKRDLDIVTINAMSAFGNNLLIPAGILREPLKALRRADIIVITKSDLVPEARLLQLSARIKDMAPGADIFQARHVPRYFLTTQGVVKGLDYIKGRKVVCVSALGDNVSFVKTVKGLGANISGNIAYIDHHQYSENDLIDMKTTLQKFQSDIIITTEKDWVKLKNLKTEGLCKGIEFLILKIKLEVQQDEVFCGRLSAVLPS